MERLTHQEIEELLGVYVLDALEETEADAVAAHIDQCPRCRAEVEAGREVVALLGDAGGAAPPGLWDKIAGSLEEAPPELRLAPVHLPSLAELEAAELSPEPPRAPVASIDDARARRIARAPRSLGSRVAVGVAALAASAAAILGVQVVRLNTRIDRVSDTAVADGFARQAAKAGGSAGSHSLHLSSPDGSLGVDAVLTKDGTGFLVSHNLPDLATDRTYQLWAIVGGDKVSLGVLGNHPDVTPFRISGDVSALAITDERAGGVVITTQPALVVGSLA